ncbi:MAG: cation:proton antiporter [Terriglobia bacterium]
MVMEHFELLRDLLILFGFATLISVVLHKARQSTIVAYLLTGILVGPSGLGVITNRAGIELMAEIGVVLLLFTLGIEFSLEKLLRMRQVVLGAGSRQVVFTILVSSLLAISIGYTWRQSLFWGFLIAASSTAIVLKLLFERQELDSPHGRAILGVLLFQDLCVVPMMALIPALAAPAPGIAFTIVYALGKALGLVAALLLVAHYLFGPLWRTIVQLRSKEIFLIATIFFSLGTAWVAGQLGLSLALGAFLAGLALSESEFAHQILSEILPFRDSFSSLFFISIGMLIHLGFVRANWTVVALLAAGIFLAKLLTGASAVLSLGFPLRMSLLVGLGLAQVGEFSFVLLQQGAGLGLVSEAGYQTFLAAAVFSMMITPLVAQASPRLAARFSEMPILLRFFPELGEAKLKQQARALNDHVIVCGYGLSGRLTARVLKQAGIPYLVLETNPETVRRAAAAQETILFGDGSSQAILAKAGAGRARAIVYAISDPFVLSRAVSNARLLNPQLTILVRTKRLEEQPILERAGASQVVSEEREAAAEIIIRLLGVYGISRNQASQQVENAGEQAEAARVE